MLVSITGDELKTIRASTRTHLEELFEEPEIAGDVAALERIGVTLLAAFDAPQAPSELGEVLVEVLTDRGCDASVALLAVLVAFGRRDVAGDAEQALRGFASRLDAVAGDVGTLVVREVWRGAIQTGEVWVAILDRPGRDATQVAWVTLQDGDTGPVAVDGLLTGTGPEDELRSGLALLAEGAERSTEQALSERLRAAVANMNEMQLAAPMEVGVCLPVLARALGGDAEALGRVTSFPELADEDEDATPPSDDSDEEVQLDALVHDYGRYVQEQHGLDSAVWRHGEFISCALLDWKHDYHDGHPTEWTATHIEEFMLDFAPRKMTMEDEAIHTLPDCLAAFMGFLDREGTLEGDNVEQLAAACERLRRRSVAACQDSSRWGMAKSIAMQMIADGVDPADPLAGEAWIAAYDLRQRAAHVPTNGRAQAQPTRSRPAGAGRAKRTAVKQARRRNRRPTRRK